MGNKKKNNMNKKINVEQIVEEMHRPARLNFKRRRFAMRGIDETWEADLLDFNLIKDYNKGYRFILIVIDCFSKFAFARVLKSKSGEETSKAFQSIFEDSGRFPR